MARGDALAKQKKWDEARKFYSFLSDTFPNDPLGRRAALKVADTFFAVKDTEGYTEAELRYKDFANRFPGDPNRPYALLMLAKCSFAQRKGPLRDLTPEREAAESLRKVLQLYPSSPYAAEAKDLLGKCVEDLAMHELLIATYYANVNAWVGARQRLDYLFANYPDTSAANEREAADGEGPSEARRGARGAPRRRRKRRASIDERAIAALFWRWSHLKHAEQEDCYGPRNVRRPSRAVRLWSRSGASRQPAAATPPQGG